MCTTIANVNNEKEMGAGIINKNANVEIVLSRFFSDEGIFEKMFSSTDTVSEKCTNKQL